MTKVAKPKFCARAGQSATKAEGVRGTHNHASTYGLIKEEGYQLKTAQAAPCISTGAL